MVRDSRRSRYRWYRIAVLAALCMFAFAYGLAVGAHHLPPYEAIKDAYMEHVFDYSAQERIDPVYELTNVSDLITLHSEHDVTSRRTDLIDFLFQQQNLPSDIPLVEQDIHDPRVASLRGIARVDRLTTTMRYNVTSVAYLFMPDGSRHPFNGKLMLYATGHSVDFRDDTATIQRFIDHGYAVAAFSMPLTGLNSRPTVTLPRFGELQFTQHDELSFLESIDFNPLRYFVEPAVQIINVKRTSFTEIDMAGISGGGFITTVTAAVDPRIRHSYPTAGTLPFYLLSGSSGTWGDYESTHVALHTIANYPELYILAAAGEGRSQTQILNQYDSCCYAGVGYQTYEAATKQALAAVGPGSFSVYLDRSHKDHMISADALDEVLPEGTT